jgi:hypothetical protein
MGREFLVRHGKYCHQQIDWIVKHDGEYFCVEVKNRELFNPPPYYGTGLDIRQIELRRIIFNDLKIDTMLLVFTDTDIYYQWIFKTLENGVYFNTKNNIRIYELSQFNKEARVK